MTVEGLLGLGGLLVAVVTAAFVFIPAMRKARTDAAVAEVDVDDKIAARRLVELTRLYDRVAALEAVAETDKGKFEALETRVADRDRAFANILNAAAEQWPKDTPGPVFDEADIAVLEDTIPAKWLRNRPPRPRTT